MSNQETAIPIPTKEVFEAISWALGAAVQEFGGEGDADIDDARDWLRKVEGVVTDGK